MGWSRRGLLRTGAAALAGAATVGTAGAHVEWEYTPESVVPVPGATDCVLQDGWAYVVNTQGMATWDLSSPQTPVPGGYAPAQAETADNRDVKVDGDVASVANNTAVSGAGVESPGGITLFDVSDPASPEQLTFYDAEDTVHNHFLYDGYAFLTQGDDMAVVDIGDPGEPELVTRWALADYREDLAAATSNNLHDICVQDDYCYLAYWEAGLIVLDVTDPAEPRVVEHDAAYQDDLVHPQNAHYVQPTPDRKFTLVGAETFSEPYGANAVYHTPALAENDPDELDSVEPVAGEYDGAGEGRDPRSLASRADPFTPKPVDKVKAPADTENAVRTAHNSDLTNDMVFSSWYQAGIWAYDLTLLRLGDPNEGEIHPIARWDPDVGDLFWSAENLASVASDDDERFYTVGADTGKGLHVLRLQQEEQLT